MTEQRTVWKWILPPQRKVEIAMPEHAKALSVGTETDSHPDSLVDTLVLWALVDPAAERVARQFLILGTGHLHEGYIEGDYIGTAVMENPRLVWHVFDTTELPF